MIRLMRGENNSHAVLFANCLKVITPHPGWLNQARKWVHPTALNGIQMQWRCNQDQLALSSLKEKQNLARLNAATVNQLTLVTATSISCGLGLLKVAMV